MTYPTEAALAALTANGHMVRRDGKALHWHTGARRWMWVAGSYMDDERSHHDDARNAVRCAMLDRIADAGYDVELWSGARPSIAKAGSVTLNKDEGIDFADLLTAYKAVCTPATPGEVAVEPERGKTLVELGITEESAKVPDGWERVKGGAMPTNEEQYEAMVAAYGEFVNALAIRQLIGTPAWPALCKLDEAVKALPSPPEPSAAEELLDEAICLLKQVRTAAQPSQWLDLKASLMGRYKGHKHAATAGGR